MHDAMEKTNTAMGKVVRHVSRILAPILALGLVAGTSAPAQAANDLETHLNESFNQSGFKSFPISADYVEVVGTISHIVFPEQERIFTVTIEGASDPATHKVVLRAFKSSFDIPSFPTFDWRDPSTQPDYNEDLVLDTTFADNGAMEIKGPDGNVLMGVTNVLVRNHVLNNNDFSGSNSYTYRLSAAKPWLLVETLTGTFVITLDAETNDGLVMCTSACEQGAIDITAPLEYVAGAGAKVASFEIGSASGDRGDFITGLLVSGATASGLPFLHELHLGMPIQSARRVSNNEFKFGLYSTAVFKARIGFHDEDGGFYQTPPSLGTASSSGDVVTLSSADEMANVAVGSIIEIDSGPGTLDPITEIVEILDSTSFRVSPAPSVDLSDTTLRTLFELKVSGINADYNRRSWVKSANAVSVGHEIVVVHGGNYPTLDVVQNALFDGVNRMPIGTLIPARGTFSGGPASLDGVVIPTSEFATGDYSGYTTYEPVKNGLITTNRRESISLVGNLSNSSGQTIGVVLQRSKVATPAFGPAASNALAHVDVGSDRTSIAMASGVSSFGATGGPKMLVGSYKDTGSSVRPLVVTSADMFSTQFSHRLQVNSTGDESLLYLQQHSLESIAAQVVAVGTDGDNLRSYTWTRILAENDSTPSGTSASSLGISGVGPNSMVISRANRTQAMFVFASYPLGSGESKLVAAKYQSLMPSGGVDEGNDSNNNDPNDNNAQDNEDSAETPPIAQPFTGPILGGVTPGGIAATAGGNVRISGQQLEGVGAASIGGLNAEIVSLEESAIELKLPAGLNAGVYDLVLVSDQGVVTIQGAILIDATTSVTSRGNGQWTKAERNSAGQVTTVKMYAKNPVNAGKIQFKVNGREIAWVRATDETDPKLRTRSNGELYLVRTVTLQPGKNALEIYIDGERVWRAAYTLR